MTRVRGSQGTHRNGHPALQLVSPDQEQCNTVQCTCTHRNHHPEPRNCSHSSKRGYSYSLEARTQLQKSNWSKVPKHTSQKRTAQRTHCKKERHRAHIAMTIRSRAIAAQLVGSGQTANWRLEAKINCACSGKKNHFSAVLQRRRFFWAIF